jgi:hypothetical protein
MLRDSAVTAADAITDEEIVISDSHAQNSSCCYSRNPGIVRPDNPLLSIYS